MFKNSTLTPENQSETEEKTREENENSTSYKCKVCDKTFSSERRKNSHIIRIHKDVIQSFQCNYCYQ
jgi:hypothetical protein